MMTGVKRGSRGRWGGGERKTKTQGCERGADGPRWDAGERLATITDPAVEREATSRTLAFGGE